MPSCILNYAQDRIWEKSFLQDKLEKLGLMDEYDVYFKRISRKYVNIFLIMHWFVTALHCVLLLLFCKPRRMIYCDVAVYLVSCLLLNVIMRFNFKTTEHKWITTVTSVAAAMTITTADLGLSYVHKLLYDWNTTTFYDIYLTLVIYMFFPLPGIWPPLILGSIVTTIYLVHFFAYLALTHTEVQYVDSAQLYRISSEVLTNVCLNMAGVFFRLIRILLVSSSILDRHQYVIEEIALRNARAKEKRFLHSILPPQIAKPIQDDIRNRIKASEKNRLIQVWDFHDKLMAIQIHTDVTILYADIVNYTYLTTKLTVVELVNLLHEMYGRFDVDSKRYDVQRIKFLGDCYYCVAGLTQPDPDHALNCVNFGLCMIQYLREIREEQKIDINIRVGVHSGELIAGVIGTSKLQYDIWGSDVVIANRLEATGMPGHVHVSDRCLALMLGHSYDVLPGTEKASTDPYLLKYGITTNLIPMTERYQAFFSSVSASVFEPDEEVDMQEELHKEFEKMPVGIPSLRKIIWNMFRWEKDENIRILHLGLFFLHFSNPRLEYEYIRQPDYLLKYTILLAWCIGASMVFTTMHYNITPHLCWVPYETMVVLTIILFITWYKKLCYWRFGSYVRNYSKFSCFIFHISEIIQKQLLLRVVIYMYIIISYGLLIHIMLIACDINEYSIVFVEAKLFYYEPETHICFHPWSLTNMVCLVIGMTSVFTRIPFMLKGLIITMEVVGFSVIMFYQYGFIVHHSNTTNPHFLAEYAHVTLLFISALSFYLMERQTEFNNKMNFQWRDELQRKKHDSRLADQSITILLHNILPAHVVNVFISSEAKHELYYEEFENVSIMFASLKDFELDLSNLRVLNEIITEFDKVLLYYREDYLVEKIKIVSCTYMAACGLDFKYTDPLSERESTRESVIKEVLRTHRSKGLKRSAKKTEVAFVITSFALDLIRCLTVCNYWYKALKSTDRAMFNAGIGIGISTGRVMAGVVGASQVHYDIWGNAVNMASRMDSTGVTGKIQVTEETAQVLIEAGIQCDYRGMTFVKGRGMLPTYFVGINDDLDFIYIPNSADNSSEDPQRSGSEV